MGRLVVSQFLVRDRLFKHVINTNTSTIQLLDDTNSPVLTVNSLGEVSNLIAKKRIGCWKMQVGTWKLFEFEGKAGYDPNTILYDSGCAELIQAEVMYSRFWLQTQFG